MLLVLEWMRLINIMKKVSTGPRIAEENYFVEEYTTRFVNKRLLVII